MDRVKDDASTYVTRMISMARMGNTLAAKKLDEMPSKTLEECNDETLDRYVDYMTGATEDLKIRQAAELRALTATSFGA